MYPKFIRLIQFQTKNSGVIMDCQTIMYHLILGQELFIVYLRKDDEMSNEISAMKIGYTATKMDNSIYL